MFPVKTLDELKSLACEMKWQYFERLVGWVFEENGFETEVGRVIKFGGIRRQFDVIAKGFSKIFLVECKRWSRPKPGLIKKAVEAHLEKCGLYEKNEGKEIIPLIVTLLEENEVLYEGVPIVPLEKLNTFINQLEEFKDKIRVL